MADDPLAVLNKRISNARREIALKDNKPASSTHYAWRVGVDFVSGVAVGSLVGYGLDQWFDSKPVFLLIGMMFGTAAGVKLMIGTAQQAADALEKEEQQKQDD